MYQIRILDEPALTLVSLFLPPEVVSVLAVMNECVLGFDIKTV